MKRQLSKYIPSTLAILIVSLSLSLTSCEAYLDQQPTDGLVLDEYWKNKEEVLSTLGGAYQKLAELDYKLFVYGEMRGDMLDYTTRAPGNERGIMTSNILTSNGYAAWGGFYSTINICNHVIDLAPSVQAKDPTFSDYLLQQYVSEATFIRGLMYFYLVRVFQDVPYITQPSTTDEGEFFPEVTLGTEILKNVKADLIAIRKKMPDHPTVQMSKSRATSGAVNALLADICLWNFEYDESITYIDAVEESGMYFLVPGTEWFKNYNPGFSLENIFEIYFDESIDQDNSVAENTYTTTNIKYLASDYALEILSVETTEAGELIRGNGSLSYSNQVWKYYGALGDKGTSRAADDNASANLIIYRLADLYLMKAEAYSQSATPNFAKALEYLNLVRTRSNMDPYPQFTNAKLFEDAILLERGKELAYEGKRWFDLLRMGRRSDTGKEKLIEILVQNVASTQQLVMKSRLSDSNGWYMPISDNEISRNKNLKQNSYYDDNE